MQLLIPDGADVNATTPRGHTVLSWAGGHGHLDTLQLLLNAGADCDAKFTHDSQTLLEWLAQYPDDPRYTPITRVLGSDFAARGPVAFEVELNRSVSPLRRDEPIEAQLLG